MTHVHTGNWAVLPNKIKEGLDVWERDDIDQISLPDIFKVTIDVEFKGQIWYSLDAPYSGLWILEIAKTQHTY